MARGEQWLSRHETADETERRQIARAVKACGETGKKAKKKSKSKGRHGSVPGLAVSAHAVIRFLERIERVDVESIRRDCAARGEQAGSDDYRLLDVIVAQQGFDLLELRQRIQRDVGLRISPYDAHESVVTGNLAKYIIADGAVISVLRHDMAERSERIRKRVALARGEKKAAKRCDGMTFSKMRGVAWEIAMRRTRDAESTAEGGVCHDARKQ